MRVRLAVVLFALAMAAGGVFTTTAARAQSIGLLRLPFAAGTTWKVAQGYNGGTHSSGPERFALDLVRDGDVSSAGADVLAPAAGTMWWMNPSGTSNGCILIKIDGGNGLIVELCHIFARSFGRDERIEAGQPIGAIAPAGAVGNNGLAHVHLSMHRTPDFGVTRIPAPFAPPDGLTLDGVALPADGSANQYACPGRTCRAGIASSNGPGTGRAPLPPAPISFSTAAPPTITLAPAQAVPLRTGVVARTAGAGDCVNVREGPGLAARVLVCLPDGYSITIGQGPIAADGRTWWQLQGFGGWAVADYLLGLTAPAPVLRVGGSAVADAGAGDCLNVREAPSLAAAVVICLPTGVRAAITDGPRDSDGLSWWQLDGRGWAAAAYLRPRDE